MRPVIQGRRLAQLIGATLLAGGLVVSAAGIAGALVDATPSGPPDVVIDEGFNLYPSITLPAGCLDGANFLVGETYTRNGGPPFTSLREGEGIGEFVPGDVIVMHWDSFAGAPECANVGVSLAVKSSSSPDFNRDIDQALLLNFAYCGPQSGAVSCAQANNTLTITMPPVDEGLKQHPDLPPACAYQVDAVLGGPLAVVGPNGSYYSNDSRRDSKPNMLISANNGGPETCPPITTTTTTASTTTTTSPTTTGSTTTTQATTTTLVTTTTPTTTPTTAGTTVPSTGATTAPEGGTPPPEVAGTTVAPADELPVTGSGTSRATQAGILMVLAGTAALAVSKRRRVEA